MEPRKYILYAEDDEEDQDLLQLAFRSLPEYTLITFEDGDSLLDYFSTTPNTISLVLLDMNMPKSDGITILKRMRSDVALADLPVIIYTTSCDPAIRAQALQLHAELIIKPSRYKDFEMVRDEMVSFLKKKALTPLM
jgi:CheY-like chemotaxis protein